MTEVACQHHIMKKMKTSHTECFDENSGEPLNSTDLKTEALLSKCAAEFTRLATCCTNALDDLENDTTLKTDEARGAKMDVMLNECPQPAPYL